MEKLERSIFKFIFGYLSKYKFYSISLLIIGFIWAIINTLLPYTLKLIIDNVVKFQGNSHLIFDLIKNDILLYLMLWILLCFILWLSDLISLKFFPNLKKDIITNMFTYLNQHTHSYFQNNFAGNLSNKVLDMQSCVTQIINIGMEFYGRAIELLIGCLALLFIHPFFAVTLISWVISFIIITCIFLKPISNLSRIFAEARSSVAGKIVDVFSNINNVRLFSRNTFENSYVAKELTDARQKDQNLQTKIIWMRISWDLSIIILLGLNMISLGIMCAKNQITIGDFSFIMMLTVTILKSFWVIAERSIVLSEQIGICKQALVVINKKHDIVDSPNAQPLIVRHGEISFKNVTFHHDNCINLFKNKNITIHGLEKVGLVGFSGSGKSTFVNLILRLFEVESGEITIDKQNIKNITQDSLRDNIILIPQDISLFHRSLMENIRYGRINATDEEVILAAKKAHCHTFISKLPNGYDTIVGERGVKLSYGQRQRVAIARAMLKTASILILDEATSSLDSITEKFIQESLFSLMQNKTTIVIAHRLSTISHMDRILVFDNGKIIESGTHENLLKLNKHYAKMWHMQSGGFFPTQL